MLFISVVPCEPASCVAWFHRVKALTFFLDLLTKNNINFKKIEGSPGFYSGASFLNIEFAYFEGNAHEYVLVQILIELAVYIAMMLN